MLALNSERLSGHLSSTFSLAHYSSK